MSAAEKPVITCRIEFALTDGVKVYNMEKYFPVPSWLQEGMRIALDGWSPVVLSYVITDVANCTQTAYIEEDSIWEPHELDAELSRWIAAGWNVESEDRNEDD